MPRQLNEIIAHIRMVAANPQVSTTLIQTEDLLLLCEAAERAATEYNRGIEDALSSNDER